MSAGECGRVRENLQGQETVSKVLSKGDFQHQEVDVKEEGDIYKELRY